MAESNKNKKEDEEDPDDIQNMFEEEVRKPYYRIDYLDNFTLTQNRLNVSIIIPSLNRCPYNPQGLNAELNPLAWALTSCLVQRPSIAEIVVVDDCSLDYTAKVVESFKKKAEEQKVKLIYVRNNKTKGYSASVNAGVNLANSKYLFFVDDDSIVAPYATFGAILTYEWLRQKSVNIGALNLAPYSRASIPRRTMSETLIGNLDFARGIFSSNKDAFPSEYLKENSDKFIHPDYHILRPIQIRNSGGYFLCTKDVFTRVGGFPLTISERYMDTEFGCALLENGYSVYLSPDPKFHCVHGSYGLKTGRVFTGPDWFRLRGGEISLKKAMEVCDHPQENTGCRIDIHRVLYNSILSFFCMAYKRNNRGAINWIKRVYKEFVENGDTTILNVDAKISLTEKERKEMWNSALKKGIDFVEKTEKQKLKSVRELKEKLKTEVVDKNILNLISEGYLE